MKKVIIIGIVFAALYSMICKGAEVTIAGDAYPLVFRDVAVSTNNQERIASDLTLALAYIDSITNAFRFSDVDRHGNSYMKQPNASCSEIDGFLRFDTNLPRKLVVEKELSDKYIAQFTKVEPYTNIVAQVDSFIAQFNSGSVTNLSISEQRALFLENGAPVDCSDEDVARIVLEYVETHFYSPSVLGFDLIRFNDVGPEYALMPVIISEEYESRKVNIAILLIHYNGAWRILGITE